MTPAFLMLTLQICPWQFGKERQGPVAPLPFPLPRVNNSCCFSSDFIWIKPVRVGGEANACICVVADRRSSQHKSSDDGYFMKCCALWTQLTAAASTVAPWPRPQASASHGFPFLYLRAAVGSATRGALSLCGSEVLCVRAAVAVVLSCIYWVSALCQAL